MKTLPWLLFLALWLASAGAVPEQAPAPAGERRLAYLVSDLRIPFWDILRHGIAARAAALGYGLEVHSAENSAKRELEMAVTAIRNRVDGIILSPTNSSAAVTVLKLAGQAAIPVVIADIGTEGGEYLSYIASANEEGAYGLGRLLAEALHARQWQNGGVGIIAIPQMRANGRARTAGFLRALEEAGIRGADIRQQVDFSYAETYRFARELIDADAELRALWLQGSDRYQGALDAIADSGRQGQILLICFDAEPEFVDMISRGDLVGAGMQQPFLIGEEAVNAMRDHFAGKPAARNRLLPVLPVSANNVERLLPQIRRHVLGLEAP